MKKISSSRYAMTAMTAVAVIATMATTSCSKTEDLSGGKGNVITTINASAGGDDQTKVYFTRGSGNIFHVTWKTSDNITVINDNANTSAAYVYGGTDNAARGSFTGSLPANSGDQLFAFYNQYGTVNAADNSITVDLSNGSTSSSSFWLVYPTMEESTNAINNSLMYAGATAGASGTIPFLKFSNANAIVTLTFGSVPDSFYYLTLVCADGGFPIAGKATAYVESGETKIKWSDLIYGGYSIHSPLYSPLDFSYSHGNLVIPGTYGPLYYLISVTALATATSVYYINTSDKVSLVAGKSYGLSKTVSRAAIVNSGGAIDDNTKNVWINQLPASNSTIKTLISGAPASSQITLIQANADAATPYGLDNNSKLVAYINDYSTALQDYMFMKCTNLKYVSLNNVTALPLNAFAGCASLEEIFLPKVTALFSYVFSACPALKKITFNSLITDTYNWSTTLVFSSTTNPLQIDLVLKAGQTDLGGGAMSGSTFHGVTFKSIKLVD